MLSRLIMTLLLVMSLDTGTAHAQQDAGPIKIRVRRIVFKTGHQYSVNIPDLEFHVLLRKQFENINSSISADYDYRRKDMGFGMSHAFTKFAVNPGISVDDNLYFREVFNDSTGIWSRSQSFSPFLVHELDDHNTLGMNFIFEREWSPKRREGADIVHYYDYSLKLVYFYEADKSDKWEDTILTLSAQRSFRIFRGQYNYFLVNARFQLARMLGTHLRYKGNIGFNGNVTPQRSPLFFIGGPLTLIGYEKDEFWGRRVFFLQNQFELIPSPEGRVSVHNLEFRRFMVLMQFDAGYVEGAADIPDLKPQDQDMKAGIGIGFGFTTDLPYMPDTPLHLLVAFPVSNSGEPKFYAGFGGWLR